MSCSGLFIFLIFPFIGPFLDDSLSNFIIIYVFLFSNLFYWIFLFIIFPYFMRSYFLNASFLIWWVLMLVLRVWIKGYLTFSSTCSVSLSFRLLLDIHFGIYMSFERLSSCLINLACLLLFKNRDWKAEFKIWTFRVLIDQTPLYVLGGLFDGRPPHQYL